MQISIDEKDIERAAKRGLNWLNSSVETPNEWNEDLVVLKFMFSGLLAGNYAIVPARSQEAEVIKPVRDGDDK